MEVMVVIRKMEEMAIDFEALLWVRVREEEDNFEHKIY